MKPVYSIAIPFPYIHRITAAIKNATYTIQ